MRDGRGALPLLLTLGQRLLCFPQELLGHEHRQAGHKDDDHHTTDVHGGVGSWGRLSGIKDIHNLYSGSGVGESWTICLQHW